MELKMLGAISKIVGDKPRVTEVRDGTVQVVDKDKVMCFTIGPGSLQALMKSLAGEIVGGRILRGVPEPDVELCFDVNLLKKALSVLPAKTTVRIGLAPHQGGTYGLLYIRGSSLPSFDGEAINIILSGVVEELEADGSRPSDRTVLTRDGC